MIRSHSEENGSAKGGEKKEYSEFFKSQFSSFLLPKCYCSNRTSHTDKLRENNNLSEGGLVYNNM